MFHVFPHCACYTDVLLYILHLVHCTRRMTWLKAFMLAFTFLILYRFTPHSIRIVIRIWWVTRALVTLQRTLWFNFLKKKKYLQTVWPQGKGLPHGILADCFLTALWLKAVLYHNGKFLSNFPNRAFFIIIFKKSYYGQGPSWQGNKHLWPHGRWIEHG